MRTTRKRRAFIQKNLGVRTPYIQRLEEIFTQSESEILGTLFLLLGSLDDAYDALEDVFVHCRNSEQLEDVQNMRVWVFRMLYNVVEDKMKNEWYRRHKMSDVAAMSDSVDVTAEDANVLVIRQAIGKLNFDEKVIFLLRQNGDLSYEQISQTVGRPLDFVKSTMMRILERLRATLQESVRLLEIQRAEECELSGSNEDDSDQTVVSNDVVQTESKE